MYKGKTIFYGRQFYIIQDIEPPEEEITHTTLVYFKLLPIGATPTTLELLRVHEIVDTYFGLYAYWMGLGEI